MAGRGPAPKAERSRARDNHTRTQLVMSGDLYGEPLPEDVLVNGEQWHPRTLAWWDAFRRNPVMADVPPSDWEFMIDTALLHHRMWQWGEYKLSSEVRLRVAKFGVSPEDRARLKLEVVTPDAPARANTAAAAAAAGVPSLDERRKRLKGA